MLFIWCHRPTGEITVRGMTKVKTNESSPTIGVALEPSRMGPKQAGETYKIGA